MSAWKRAGASDATLMAVAGQMPRNGGTYSHVLMAVKCAALEKLEAV